MMGPPDEDAPLVYGAFQNFLRGGATQEEAESWLRKHRDEFPSDMRKKIDQILKPIRTEEQILEIITRDRSKKPAAAKGKLESDEPPPRSREEYERRCKELHREGGVALQWPYIFTYGKLFR